MYLYTLHLTDIYVGRCGNENARVNHCILRREERVRISVRLVLAGVYVVRR